MGMGHAEALEEGGKAKRRTLVNLSAVGSIIGSEVISTNSPTRTQCSCATRCQDEYNMSCLA